MADRYVVTWAQNATPVDKPFLGALRRYCAHHGARLVVIPGRYKNPTSIWTQNNDGDEWWAPEVVPHLEQGRLQIGRLIVYGDIRIQPTARRPLTGFEVFMGKNSAVFGHPKVQLQTVATAQRYYPRIATTTGACTVANYTDTKAGRMGEAHHVLGATVIEAEGERFHVRQITATGDGSFTDLTHRFSETGVSRAPRPLALVPGDIHVEMLTPEVCAATFDGDDSICRVLKPQQVVCHDTLDFRRRNHHNADDPQDRYARANGLEPSSVEDEVTEAVRFLDAVIPADCEPVVVASNHDEAFDRWLRRADVPKDDPVNVRFWHWANLAVLQHYEAAGEWLPAFEAAYRALGEGRARFMQRNEPLTIAGIECGFHGDQGLNGARVGLLTYAKLGVKTITGHKHTPSITDGNYTVGVTGSLDQGYNTLPSSWMHSHALVYADGKRTLVHVVDGAWRAGQAYTQPQPPKRPQMRLPIQPPSPERWARLAKAVTIQAPDPSRWG